VILEPSTEIRPSAARAAAASVFVHCFPLMLADAVRSMHPAGSRRFQLVVPGEGGALAQGLAEDDMRVVLSSAWIDLAEEPVVIRAPHTHGRHFNLTLIDSAGEPFAGLGSGTGEDTGLDLALAGPHWRGELPNGLKAKRAPSDSVWAVSRIQAYSSFDRPEALEVASRQSLALLHPSAEWTAAAMAILEPRSSSCLRQVEDMAPSLFFQHLDAILDRAPARDQQMVRLQVAALRNQLGGPARSADWSATFSHALARGFSDGMVAIRTAAQAMSKTDATGWRSPPNGAPDEPAGPLGRAARAYASLGAPLREDQLSLECDRDEFGLPLTGEHGYRLHFDKRAAPPVHGFWWLSVRPTSSFGPRHGLGSRSDLALNPDGSLDLFIQHEPPEASKIPNWLRTPTGGFSLVMRLYCPRPEALSGPWRMPQLEREDTALSAAGERVRSASRSSFLPAFRTTFGRRAQFGR
jgi:hypothetical protein